MFGDVDANYFSDPYKARFQMGYVFTYGGIITSWRSIKKIMETCELPSIRCNVTKLYESQLLGYVDANYFSDPYRARFQMRYVFTYGGTTSWRSIKKIMETCELPSIRHNATKLYENNVLCIGHIKECCIKSGKIKHISPKFFYIIFHNIFMT